jgi:hypothetical protein
VSASYLECARRRLADTGIRFDVGDALTSHIRTAPSIVRCRCRRWTCFRSAARRRRNAPRYPAVPSSSSSPMFAAARRHSACCGIQQRWTLEPARSATTSYPGSALARRPRPALPNGSVDRVKEQMASTPFEYTSFDDYWSTSLTGQGRLGG